MSYCEGWLRGDRNITKLCEQRTFNMETTLYCYGFLLNHTVISRRKSCDDIKMPHGFEAKD